MHLPAFLLCYAADQQQPWAEDHSALVSGKWRVQDSNLRSPAHETGEHAAAPTRSVYGSTMTTDAEREAWNLEAAGEQHDPDQTYYWVDDIGGGLQRVVTDADVDDDEYWSVMKQLGYAEAGTLSDVSPTSDRHERREDESVASFVRRTQSDRVRQSSTPDWAQPILMGLGLLVLLPLAIVAEVWKHLKRLVKK